MKITINELANWVIVIAYSGVFIFAMAMIIISWIKQKTNKSKFKKAIELKVDKRLSVSADDFMRMIRVSNISIQTANTIISELIFENLDEDKEKIYQELIQKLEKIEPFGNLPKDLNLIIQRLVEIVDQTDSKSDRYLLIPLQQALEKSRLIEEKQKKSKNMNSFVFLIGMFSFVISIGGLYISAKSPSKDEIAKIINDAVLTLKK